MDPASLTFHQFSQTGLHHLQHGQNNEDFCCIRQKGPYIAMALADGVSTCCRSEDGARLGANVAVKTLLAFADTFMSGNKGKILDFILQRIELILTREADIQGYSLEDFSAGMACVLLDTRTRKVLALSRGNIMVMAECSDAMRLLLPVEDDRYGIRTIADHNAAWRFIGYEELPADARLWMLSDGAWKHICTSDTSWREFYALRQHPCQVDYFFYGSDPWDDCTYCTLDLNWTKNQITKAERFNCFPPEAVMVEDKKMYQV